MADNYGRKAMLNIMVLMLFAGGVLLVSALNIWMVSIGLFFSGLATSGITRLSTTVIFETCDQLKAEYFTLFWQFLVLNMSLVIGVTFIAIDSWRTNSLLYCLVPTLILVVIYWLTMEETPRYLVQNSNHEHVVESLERIAKINKSHF